MIVAVVSMILGVAYSQNHLILETKLNSPSFLAKNREEFAKHTVTAGIGSVIGGVIGYCIGRFLK
jgi:membrane protein YqaA with SNARE-associated domain